MMVLKMYSPSEDYLNLNNVLIMKTIKFGSSGYEVIKLQEYLNLKATGDFDMDTHEAVIQFQKEHGLTPDGVVGPITWAALKAAVDTHVNDFPSSNPYEAHFLPEGKQTPQGWIPNYFKGPVPKRWIFFHHTAGWDSPYTTIKGWEMDTHSIGTEYVVGGPSIKGTQSPHDGKVLRAFPEGGFAWHLTIGNNTLHKESIGIEICSFGGLTKGGYFKLGKTWTPLNPNSYYAWTGTEVPENQVTDIGWDHRGFRYFHSMSNAQIEATKELTLFLCKKYDINPKKGLQEMIHKHGVQKAFNCIGQQECTANPGLYTHGHVYCPKNDIFPQQEFIDMIMSL